MHHLSHNVGMADAVRAGPLRKTRERHYVPGETVWCGTLHAPSPEALLRDLTVPHLYSHALISVVS